MLMVKYLKGTKEMKKIAESIIEGSEGFFKA